MRKLLYTFLALMFSSTLMATISNKTGDLHVIDISAKWNPDHWDEKSFKDNTEYTRIKLDNAPVLKASTNNNASALYRQIEIDLQKTPYLNWSWRVEGIYSGLNPKIKMGDDYPARLYVVYQDGFLPWQALSLNYVWANSAPEDEHWPNPFTDKAIMIPVSSSTDGLGQWHHYKFNVREDFKRTFDMDISEIHGIAVMADSDNAGQQAVSYFGDIRFSAN